MRGELGVRHPRAGLKVCASRAITAARPAAIRSCSTRGAPSCVGDEVSVAIVGSGFSGIGLAVNLRREGVEDFVVLERGAGVGGTWHYNTYPWCACDVPSNLYSFSFAPNPDWSRTYSRQPEIRAYLERVVDQFGVRPKIRLNTEVLAASWHEESRRWRIDTASL